MEPFITYLIKSSVWLSAFGLVYFLFLRHERFFRLNRLFLIAGLLSSIVFPLITINYTVTIPQVQESASIGELYANNAQTTAPPIITWENIAIGILLSGTLLFIIRMLIQTLKVIKTIRRSEVQVQKNLKVVKSIHLRHSFSFFSYIFVNPASPEREIREIVAHEAAHVSQYHWVDLILAELLCAFQWFNPMAWLYSHFIRQNHEYLADQSALRSSPDPAFYKATLLNHLLGSEVIRLGHSFSYSLNKKRFIMMKNTSIPIIRKMKLLFILPVAALIFYSFSEPQYAYETNSETTASVETKKAQPAEKSVIQETENQLPATSFISQSNSKNTSTKNEELELEKAPPKLEGDKESVQGQQSKGKTIEGKVIEENGNPLPGTSIIVVNTTNGTVADKNGEFRLADIPGNAEVSFSFVGFETKRKSPEFNKEMVVLLKKDTLQKDLNVTIRSNNNNKPEANPIIYLDGKKVPFETLNEISPNKFASIDVLKDQSAIKKYGEEGKNGVIHITSKKESSTKPEETIEEITKSGLSGKNAKKGNKTTEDKTFNGKPVFFIVEDMPKFPGGDAALNNYFLNNLEYPKEAKEKGIEGRVYVSYIISPKGKVANVTVVRGVDPTLDAEAKRVVEKMPDWIPGKQRGKNVAVNFTSPVNFKL